MQLKIGVIGSCTSRDPFTTFFNKDYKSFFKVVISAQRTSVISFMSKPFNFDENTLKVMKNNEHIFQRTKNLLYDFNRCAFKELQQKEIDYLVIDNYFEIGFGIMCINNKFMVTNNTALYNTEFLDNLKEKKTITIGKNTKEYLKLYKKYCDNFFNYMETNLPDVGIILNKSRLVYNILTKTGELYVDQQYKSCSKKYNPLLSKLDNYIEKNYEIDTIEFDKDTLAYEDHRWGKAAVHYIDSYYTNFIKDVKYICLSDRIQKLKNNLTNDNRNTLKLANQNDINCANNLFDDLNNINQLFNNYSNSNNKESATVLLKENNFTEDMNKISLKTVPNEIKHNVEMVNDNYNFHETNEIYNNANPKNATSTNYNDMWQINGTASITSEIDGTVLTGEKWASINLKCNDNINFPMGNYIFEFDVININGNDARLNFYDGNSNQIILSKGHYKVEITNKIYVKKDNIITNTISHDTNASYFQLNFNINNDNVQLKFKNIKLCNYQQ